MKRSFLILALAAVCAVLPSCTKENPFDDSEIWEAIEALKTRIAAVEKNVAENVSAIQSMVSLGSISAWDFDAETGKGVITLVDGKKITVDQTIKGYSLITVYKDSDGNYYWATCKDGVTTPLEIGGKKVPVTVTPALKISEENEWLISVDGGKTWVGTGIMYHDAPKESDKPSEPETPSETEKPSEPETQEVVFFQDVKQEGNTLVLTLADGTVVTVAIVGETIFSASSDTLWFSRADMQKSVAVEMVNVKAYTITEKPEGWKASMDDSYRYVTSPVGFTEYPKSGTVKVLAVFETGAPEILSLEVVYEPMFSVKYANGKVAVTLSEHTGEDFNGYVLAGWKKGDYSVDAAVEWLNAEAGSLVPFEGTSEYLPEEVIADYTETEDYIIAAVPYLPAMQVLQGNMQYLAEDVLQVTVNATKAAWKFSDVRFDSATLTAEMEPPFFGGFFEAVDWTNYGLANLMESLKVQEMEPYTMTSYKGPANAFPDGEIGMAINPATDYVVWYLPVNESGKYTEEDVVVYTFTTPDIYSDSSISAPSFTKRDATTAGFTADVTPAAGAYKTYAAIMKAGAIPESEIELVRYVIDANHYSSGQAVNTVSNYSVSSDDEVYIVAVSVSKEGGYGKVFKEKVEIAPLQFTDDLGVEVTDIQYGIGDVTLSIKVTGTAESITYFAATYTYYTDDVIQRLLALGQYGQAQTANLEKLNGKVYLTGLDLGALHTFYAVVKDADGVSSKLYKYEFTPRNDVDYVMSYDENYEYGMPQLSSSLFGTTLTLKVDMPDTCRKYWLYRGDSEYFTGDPYSDSDALVTEQLLGVTIHETSESGLKYTQMYDTARVYMVWLDDKGEYHAIYEYNPRKN